MQKPHSILNNDPWLGWSHVVKYSSDYIIVSIKLHLKATHSGCLICLCSSVFLNLLTKVKLFTHCVSVAVFGVMIPSGQKLLTTAE